MSTSKAFKDRPQPQMSQAEPPLQTQPNWALISKRLLLRGMKKPNQPAIAQE
jgi:hypothetical protein